MKKSMAMLLGCLVVAGLTGCCNIETRVDDEFAPYACAPHPYYCTAETWPYVVNPAHNAACGRMAAFMIQMWPIFVVDEVCEVALDTVLLPVDLIGQCCRTDEQRKKLEQVYEKRKMREESKDQSRDLTVTVTPL